MCYNLVSGDCAEELYAGNMDLNRGGDTPNTPGGITANGSAGDSNVAARDCRLHKAAFHGDVSEVEELLKSGEVDPSAPDKHGKILSWLS